MRGLRVISGKVRTRLGETLVETLVAVLLCGIAAALLMTSISVSGSLNQGARAATRQEQVQSANAARFYGYLNDDGEQVDASTGTVVIADKGDSSYTETFSDDDVKVYGGPLIVSYGIEEGNE